MATIETGNFPVAPGYPQLSGTAIPTIWSTLWNAKFYEQTVLPQISNTDWELEVRDHGDQVIIRNIPTIPVYKYFKNQSITYDTPEVTTTELKIDQAYRWGFSEDIIDLAQTDINFVQKQIEDASNQVKIAVEREIFSLIFADADIANQGVAGGKIAGTYNFGAPGSPLPLSSTSILPTIIRAGSALDEQNVPDDGTRWLVIPSEVCGMIKNSDFKNVNVTGDSVSIARDGKTGMIDRFNVFCSNNLTVTSDSGFTVYNMMAGHRSALTFAGQVTKSEVIDSEFTFGKKFRGLFSYGYKVVKPEALVWIYGYAVQS